MRTARGLAAAALSVVAIGCGGAVDARVDVADAAGDASIDSAPACAAGLAMCGATCVDLAREAANCGSCGHACAKRESCDRGRCGYGWTVAIGGATTDETPEAIAIDASGDSFIVGRWGDHGTPAAQTTDLGGGAVVGHGGEDGLIVSLDPNGAFRWAVDLGGAYDDRADAVAIDASGNVFVTGWALSRGFHFDATHTTAASDPTGSFVASYTNAGVFRWGHTFENSLGSSLAVDAAGNVFTGGDLGSGPSADFGTGVIAVAGTSGGAYLASFDNAGLVRWANVYSHVPANANIASLSIDRSGNVYASGCMNGAMSLGGPVLPYSPGATAETFVASYTNAGVARWSKSFAGNNGGASIDRGPSLAADELGHIAVGGSFTSTADFGGGPVIDAHVFEEGFVVLLNAADGSFYKQRVIPPGNVGVFTVGYDSAGNLFAGGHASHGDFGGGPTGEFGGFVAAYTNSLGYRFERVAAGGNPIEGIAVAPAGTVYATGRVESSVDFGFGRATSHGGVDMFVARLP